jgi:hypothetical protein
MPMKGAPADSAEEVLTALRRRVEQLEPGRTADLGDLSRADRFGPDAFAALARRFGLADCGNGEWRQDKAPRWTPGWIGPADQQRCLDLFESAFGYRMDERLWRWKYRDANPLGVGVWQGDRLVAFYGGMPRDVLVRGQAASAVQIGDVMVEPSQRGVMTRSGPFQIAASTFLERRIGNGRPHLLGFGFPTAKALQVAQRLGLYAEVDQIAQITWTAGASWKQRIGMRMASVTPADAAVVDMLWDRMASDFAGSIIGVRNWNYIEARYLRHPTVEYRCLLVKARFGGAAHALIVLRALEDGNAELVDIVGPRASFDAAVRAARDWAAGVRATRVTAWITASHANTLDLQSAEIASLDLFVPTNVWSPGPAVDEVRGRWWLMAGDTDFR